MLMRGVEMRLSPGVEHDLAERGFIDLLLMRRKDLLETSLPHGITVDHDVADIGRCGPDQRNPANAVFNPFPHCFCASPTFPPAATSHDQPDDPVTIWQDLIRPCPPAPPRIFKREQLGGAEAVQNFRLLLRRPRGEQVE